MVTTTIRQHFDSIKGDDEYDEPFWRAYSDMMTRAEVNVDQEMTMVHADYVNGEPIIELGAGWYFVALEYGERVYHDGVLMIEIDGDTEKGGWGFTATFNGKEYYCSHYGDYGVSIERLK